MDKLEERRKDCHLPLVLFTSFTEFLHTHHVVTAQTLFSNFSKQKRRRFDTICRAVVELTRSEKVEGCSFVRTEKRKSRRRNNRGLLK